MCAWLDIPSYVQEDITRIYANLKARGKTTEAGITIEEQLAKIARLACLIHRLPRNREDIEHRIRELYGSDIGTISSEFVKAANTRLVSFYTRKEGKYQYLRRYENANGKPVNYVNLGKL